MAALSPKSSSWQSKAVKEWNKEDVIAWLLSEEEERFQPLVDVFRKNAVKGKDLLKLDDEVLKESFGIADRFLRIQLLGRIEELKTPNVPHSPLVIIE